MGNTSAITEDNLQDEYQAMLIFYHDQPIISVW